MSQLTVIEESPQGRYKKLSECLGSGSFKKVYRGFDTTHGRDVAWNEIFVAGLPEKEKERFASEVELLRFLDNEHFIKYYSSWYDEKKDKIVLITQIVTSGTLNNYVKGKQLSMEVIKRWSLQILEALNYLHTRDPPIIHRDLKCSNIFIDGKTSTILIGDLGLSKRRKETQMSIAGTPEFMAPEIFANGVYDEKVDIYAFGMCVLELITKKVPYGECQSIRDIYTKGELPECLDDVKDESAKAFIKKLIAKAPTRPSARELLNDPFLNTITERDKEFIDVDSQIIEQEKKDHDNQSQIKSQLNTTEASLVPDSKTQAVKSDLKPTQERNSDDIDWSEAAERANLTNLQPSELVTEQTTNPTIKSSNYASVVKEGEHEDMISTTIISSSSSVSLNSLGLPTSPVHTRDMTAPLAPALRETHAHIFHKRNYSSFSAGKSKGFGSDTMSPSLVNGGLPSSNHRPSNSLENMDLSPNVYRSVMNDDDDTMCMSSNNSTMVTSDGNSVLSNQQACNQQLVIVFDSDDEQSSETPREKEPDSIERMLISIVKQEAAEFTFRIKYKDQLTTSNWTQVIRYTYGLSKPENLVSDLVNNGFIKECLLDSIAEVFDNWLTKFLTFELNRTEKSTENNNAEAVEN